MTAVRDLFDLPESIGKRDFVLQLTEGVQTPEQTAKLYCATPGLVESFDRALTLVGTALRDGRSHAAYLHGSFGSGKSHFMAIASLLIEGSEAAWRIPALHVLREKHEFVGKKKLLQLRLHMVGADSIEQKVFGAYVDYVQTQHPNATVPALFADDQLFEDARHMLEELGDAAFFKPMNAGVDPGAQAGWGKYADTIWDRAKFDQASQSSNIKEREQLFSALVKTRFTAYAQESRAYVDMDAGLGVISRHAKDLGYDAILLFLDELILWLSHGAANASWLHGEVQKMVKLVESQESSREIPFVSFIARQRNLAEMVGDQYAGAETARLQDSLSHWEGRYDTIPLEDRNLPDIIEHRVLRTKSDAAKQSLDAAFDRMKKAAGPAWQTLLGEQDEAAFRKTYPFSPALVEALIALSSFLQRERTAIRVLMEMLHEHLNDLEVGEVAQVGDLFDLLAGGADAVDGVMRSRFETAKQLYKYQLLPVIQKSNGTTGADRCQREREEHPVRLGCSNCTEKACRGDNRLLKTLIIAALVPEVKALRNMTASRLVQLNHGTLKGPLPGTEAGSAAQRLRNWASEVSQLRVGEGTDPSVGVNLEGVDVGPILEAAREHDKPGDRQRLIRDLLFEAMGVDKVVDWGRDHTEIWRNTKRLGHVRFGNVRRMGADQLRVPEDHEWRLIVDYPFDDPGHGPNDDLEVCNQFMEETSGSWTLVWLPHFFSESTNRLLGELVILEHILESAETERRYVSHLSVENQQRAHLDLDNLRNQKRARIRQILSQAYGLAQPEQGVLDTSAMVDTQLVVLKPGTKVRQQLAANLDSALPNYLGALLEEKYPRHPHFTEQLTNKRVESMVELFGKLCDAEGHRIAADKGELKDAGGTLGVLGLVRLTENAIFLMPDRLLQTLEQRRAQKGLDLPTVGEMRRFIDEQGTMGLQPVAQDLIVRCYARWANRTFVSLGKAYSPNAKLVIPDEVVLEKPDLPSQEAWNLAITKAGTLFGIALPGRALHAEGLKRFEEQLNAALAQHAGPCAKLPQLLEQRIRELGLAAESERLTTARSADQVCAALQGKPAVEQVNVLATLEPKTSAKAAGRSIATSLSVQGALQDDLAFGVFSQLAAKASTLPGAAECLEEVGGLLRQDELIVALPERLRQLALNAQSLLQPRVAVPAAGERVVFEKTLSASGMQARDTLDQVRMQLETAIKEYGDSVTISGHLSVRVKSSK
ncbi:MAG: hypothetical protein R3B13_15345 [Polyangiaceae bacterium]